MFALAVYAFTFGHYFANAIGTTAGVKRLASVAILALFVAINLALATFAEGIRLALIRSGHVAVRRH